MYCKFCYRPISDDILVCPHCGKPNTPSPKKKLSAVWVFIFTFVFLLVVGLAASAFPHIQKLFSDKKVGTPITDEGETLPTFTKESTESINGTLGNSIVNYSSFFCQLVECKDYIFHSYNEDYQIIMVEKSTDKSTPLPIYGINLSIYDNVLYYTSPDMTSVFAYNLLSGNIYCPPLPVPPTEDSIYHRLFVSSNGFVIIYTDDYLKPILTRCLNFEGNVIAEKIINSQSIILSDNCTISAHIGSNLFTYSIPSLNENSYYFPESVAEISSCGDGFVYCNEYNKSVINVLDLKTSVITQLQIDNENVFIVRPYDKKIYYTTSNGTFTLDPQTTSPPQELSTLRLTDFSFTTNGYIYAFNSTSSPPLISRFIGFHVRIKLDGKDLTVLSH